MGQCTAQGTLLSHLMNLCTHSFSKYTKYSSDVFGIPNTSRKILLSTDSFQFLVFQGCGEPLPRVADIVIFKRFLKRWDKLVEGCDLVAVGGGGGRWAEEGGEDRDAKEGQVHGEGGDREGSDTWPPLQPHQVRRLARTNYIGSANNLVRIKIWGAYI